MRVIKDDEAGLLLWQADGSEFATLVDADGHTPHDMTPDRMRDPKLTVHTWRGDVLILMPPEASYSVWWFFEDRAFSGWYVNLETPFHRGHSSVETKDLVLDIVVTPQRHWQWKDTDEFDRRIGHPLYFDSITADAIRGNGEQLIKLIEAGDFPFDGTHIAFRPDPHWPLTRLGDDIP